MLRVLHLGVCEQPIQVVPGCWSQRGVQMTMVRYAPRRRGAPPSPSEEIDFHPTMSRHKLAFVPDAVRIGTRLHAARPFDLILADDPMGSGLAGWLLRQRLKIPLIIRCHTQYFGHLAWVLERPYYPLYYLLARFLLPRADRIEVPSEHVAQTIVGLGIDRARIRVVHPPTQSSRFFPPAEPRRFAGQLLFVGQLLPGKGVQILLEALRILRGRGYAPRLEIAGSGPQEAILKSQVVKLGLSDGVSFLGFVPRDRLVACYQNADVLVLPTLYEAFARVCAEAALCGLPVIASDVGGIKEAVRRDETALLVPPQNPHALAGAIQTFLEHPARAAAIGAAALAFAQEHYDFDRMLDTMVATWREAEAAGNAALHPVILSSAKDRCRLAFRLRRCVRSKGNRQ